MDDKAQRLIKRFHVIFPDLPESQIPSAPRAALGYWHSCAAITRDNVVEEEFSIPMDFDRCADLDSFDCVRQWLMSETQAA